MLPSSLQSESLVVTQSQKIDYMEYDGGVLAIDADFVRENLAACYLLEAETEVAFIEVGTNSSTPRLMQLLKQG